MKIIREIPLWLLIIGLMLVISGCSYVHGPVVMTSIPAALTAPPTPTAAQEYTQTIPTPTAFPTHPPALEKLEKPQYSLAAVLDYQNHYLSVEEEIRIPHPANAPLDNIILIVSPNNWPGVLTIQEISAGKLIVGGYEINGIKLTIDFSDPGWVPGEILDLHIRYALELPPIGKGAELGTSPFGYSSVQTNLVDWYPMVPPYQDDQGWVIHDPWKFGEHLVFPAADFEVSLELSPAGLTAAASSVPLKEGNPALYSLESARNFVFSISPDYYVLAEDLNGTRVLGYSLPGYHDSGRAVFDATVEALGLYADLYGPYGQSGLSVVQGDFDYGMEYEGLYFQGRGYYDTYNGSQQSYLVTIAVHETAHQWWFGKVANDQALEPWLDEALCTFSELAYYEQLYPQSVDWWWRTRVNYYDPEGRIDRSIYDFEKMSDPYLNYRNATYLQGAKFLAALKDELGDEVFYDFLSEFVVQNRDQISSKQDFFSLLEIYLDVSNLDWIREYFPDL